MLHFKASKLAILAAMLVALVSAPVDAMTYSYRLYHDQIVVDASGAIEANERAIFLSWLNGVRESTGQRRVAAVVFNSLGGSVLGGADLASAIWEAHGVNTGVAAGGTCASACVIAWSAGAHKSVAPDARIGVHEPSFDGALSMEQIAFLHSLTEVMAETLAKAGAPPTVVAAARYAPSNNIYWLTLADLAAWSVKVTY